jgi:hypothetical protein
MRSGGRAFPPVLVLAVLALPLLGHGAGALSCDPDRETVVGVIRVAALADPREAAEVPYWTEAGCGQEVDAAPAAVRGETLAFLELERPATKGSLKTIDLESGERHRAEVSISTSSARLAIAPPYVYALHGGYGSRVLTGWPLWAEGDADTRNLRYHADERVALGVNRAAVLDRTADPPLLSVLDLDAWGYRLRDHPLPVAEGSSWRLLATSERWTIFDEHDAAVEDWDHVQADTRLWAYEHARDRMHAIREPLAQVEATDHEEAWSAWGFFIDGDRLHYTVYPAVMPWIPEYVRSLRLPSGMEPEISELRGLHAPPYVESGRIVLFQRSDAASVPDWDDVEVQRYHAPPFWETIPFPSLALLLATGAAIGALRRRLDPA